MAAITSPDASPSPCSLASFRSVTFFAFIALRLRRAIAPLPVSLKQRNSKIRPMNTTVMAEIAIPTPIGSCSVNFSCLGLLSMVLLLVLGVTYFSSLSFFTSHSADASLTRAYD